LAAIAHNNCLLQHVCMHDQNCSCFYTPCEKCKTDKAPPGTRALPPGMLWGQLAGPAFVPSFGEVPRPERTRAHDPRPAEHAAAAPKASGAAPAAHQRSLFGEPAPEPTPAPAPAPKAAPGAKTGLPKRARHAAGSDTSSAAADSLSDGVLGELQLKVLEVIIACKGMTCDEVELNLGLRHQTASARINELVKAKYIEDSGERRDTSSGRKATVWKPTRRASE
jgi:hypothetical protein